MECAEPFKIEALIKRVFNEKFRLIAGKEYFEGNETDMKTNFIEIVTNYKPSEKLNIQDKPIIGITKGLVCSYCSKSFVRMSLYKNHIDNGKCKGILVNSTVTKPSEPDKVTCSICNSQFTNKYTLKRHLETVCEPNQVKSILENPIACKLLERAVELVASKFASSRSINNNNCDLVDPSVTSKKYLEQTESVKLKLN